MFWTRGSRPRCSPLRLWDGRKIRGTWKRYPTSLLITGFDILFFWVARMIMMGCHFMSPPHKPSALSSRQSGHSEILATDLRIDGLAGGEASVRITHIPTGLEIVSREGHTQQDNRVLAMEMLQKRLEERYLAESVRSEEHTSELQ